MPDIKLKPTMDKPKLLETSHVPREAGAMLKEQYKAKQARHKPSEKAPVQYATDEVEDSGERTAAAVTMGVQIGRAHV